MCKRKIQRKRARETVRNKGLVIGVIQRRIEKQV